MITSPISAGATEARATASRTATAPRSAADTSLNTPPNAPIGVRQALRMTASKSSAKGTHLVRHDQFRAGRRPDPVDRRVGPPPAQDEAGGRPVNPRHPRHDEVDPLQAGERQRAPLQDLVTALAGRVLH